LRALCGPSVAFLVSFPAGLISIFAPVATRTAGRRDGPTGPRHGRALKVDKFPMLLEPCGIVRAGFVVGQSERAGRLVLSAVM
jgi:hypothetical protein